MPTSYLAKPRSPLWQPGAAPAGCRLYLPFHEGSGTVVRDLAGRAGGPGTFTGSPAWQTGPMGPQLGGFTTTNYVTADGAAAIFGPGPPFWVAVLAANGTASSTLAYLSHAFNNAGVSQELTLYANSGSSGQVGYFVKGDGSNSPSLTATGTALNDGRPHVLMGVSSGVGSHRLYFDGGQVASSATTLSAATVTLLTCKFGVSVKAAAASPWPGSILAAAAGQGAIPDPTALAQDWLSGRFAAVRPRPPALYFGGFAGTGGGGPAFQPAWAAGSISVITGYPT